MFKFNSVKLTNFTNIEAIILLSLFLILSILALLAHTDFFNLDLRFALNGFSILEVIQAHDNPDGFIRDFPGGSRDTTSKSPTIYLYLLGHLFNADAMIMTYVMIFLEMSVLLFGAWMLWRSIVFHIGNKNNKLRSILNFGFVWVAFFLLVSSAQSASVSNFVFPFFHGQFYGFADGLRLAFLAMMIRFRWILAIIIFFLCFIIHPIKAVIAIGVAIPIIFINWRSLLNFQVFIFSLVIGIACALWYFFTLSPSTASVPLDDFVAYTRSLQSHWYPFDMGLFGKYHYMGVSPFISLTLIMFVALAQKNWDEDIRKIFQFGTIILLILCALGLYISIIALSDTLIKISFVRASNLISLLAPLIIIAGAIFAWSKKRWVMAAVLLSFMLTTFSTLFSAFYMPPLYAICVVILHFYYIKKITLPLFLFTLIATLYIFWLVINYGGASSLFSGALPVFFVSTSIWILFKFISYRGDSYYGFPVIIIYSLLCVCGSLFFVTDKYKTFKVNADLSQAYKETQLWANKNTEETALFMVDPCRWYGWRDFSGRASIGTVREWFMTAWGYVDRGDLLIKGKEISKTLGFDMEPFKNISDSSGKICKVARSIYYDPNTTGIKKIANRYDVDYFVFEKMHAKDFPKKLEKQAVFQNNYFFILRAETLEK